MRTSFWLVPCVLIVVALVAAYATIRIDQSPTGRMLLELLPGHDQLTVDGARQMVSSVAGSTITVASLVFSLTFVALTLMSQQFGPRIILVFMNDQLTKFVIGAFAGTFLYSLIVLGAVGIGQGELSLDAQNGLATYGIGTGQLFIPKLSVYAVSVLGILSFILIIFFVHHMAMVIQADAIVARLGNELEGAIKGLLSRGSDDSEADFSTVVDDPDEDEFQTIGETGHEIMATGSGYVQFIDFDRLVEVATEHDAKVELNCRPGHFIVEGRPVARAATASGTQDELDEAIWQAIELGERRTQAQAAEYEVNALVEVALRALSPGINDPFTAIACLDRLTDSLATLLQTEVRPSIMRDSDGAVRVYRHPQAFKHFLDSAFHPIRQTARNSFQTLVSMVHSLEVLSALAQTDLHRAALLTHAEALKQDCMRETENTNDEEFIMERLERVRKKLSAEK